MNTAATPSGFELPRVPDRLLERFTRARAQTRALVGSISAEDAMIQSMPDASPSKWHLAHTTWFFERFVLGSLHGFQSRHPDWDYLFNSYYQSVGSMHARPRRGLISRPSLAEVMAYRTEVETALAEAMANGALDADAQRVVEIGLHHEQQHQELILTDIKHALFANPLLPAYREGYRSQRRAAGTQGWRRFDQAIVEVGATAWPQAADAFAYDNESPRHSALVGPFELAERPVTCGEYLEFIRDRGYRTPALWLSEGWVLAETENWSRPLYWLDDEREFTLDGVAAIDRDAPVCHLSYYEADAFARWAGARLPTEFEWECAAAASAARGNFVDSGRLHPLGDPGAGLRQMLGDVWEWTSSAYSPYPGFRTWSGSLGEYNGKFMCGQWVLRGGSCATPADHIRASYRNFFPPSTRWQFAGLRIARDIA